MEPKKIKFSENIYLNIRDGYYKVLVLENCGFYNGLIQKIINEHKVKSVVITGRVDTSVFDEIRSILSLTMFDNEEFNINGFDKLSKLKSIDIENSYKAAIDFSHFKEIEDIEIKWNPEIKFEHAKSLKWLRLRKYEQKFWGLRLPKNLDALEIIQGKLQSISGIESLTSLKSLDLSYLPKLESFGAIGELKNLEYLGLSNCGSLHSLDFIKKLKKLKWLCIVRCKEIDSLSPLKDLPNLVGVNIYDNKFVYNDKSICNEKTDYHVYPYKKIIQRLYEEL